MAKIELGWATLLGVLVGACTAPLGGSGSIVELETFDGRALDDVAPVSRFRLRGIQAIDVADVWLVPGEVSSTSAKRMRRGDPPTTLEQGRLALSAWRESEDIVVAPLVRLEAGETYTLVALGAGELGRFVVSEESEVVFERVEDASVSFGGWVSYCSALPFDSGIATASRVQAGPGVLAVDAKAGFAGTTMLADRCVSLRLPDAAESDYFLPPPRMGSALLAPEPLALTRNPPTEVSLSWCEGQALERCAGARRAAIEVSVPRGVSALTLSPLGHLGERVSWVGAVDAPTVIALGPLTAGAAYQLDGVRLLGGRAESTSTRLTAGPAEGRLVLTEVLTNPLGPEPDAEWVEVFNAGTAPVQLAGHRLMDATGETLLPSATLKPGGYGLLVGQAYRADPEMDVIPAASAVPLVVPKIGQGGLLNAGEALSLLDPEGQLVSKIPALEGAAGVSVVRVSVWASDLPSSFVLHGPPGASPGEPSSNDASPSDD